MKMNMADPHIQYDLNIEYEFEYCIHYIQKNENSEYEA